MEESILAKVRIVLHAIQAENIVGHVGTSSEAVLKRRHTEFGNAIREKGDHYANVP